ncbi:MAG: hypothetical protein FWD83_01375 [Promicromonosporaceae bacterium]|nr:hypothetical protein [Promicromonosporaceae bacterium]
MSQAIHYVSYKLKKDASIPDFLAAQTALGDEEVSKQPGFVSWQLMRAGDIWADAITFETMDDLLAFEAASSTPSELARKFYSFLNLSAAGSSFRKFEVVATR